MASQRSKTTTLRIPKPALRRLPGYLRCLHALHKEHEAWVSCTYLADYLKMDSSLVRKDLAYTGVSGRPKLGYEVSPLTRAIERLIGWDNRQDAFLVGVGNLGRALLGHLEPTLHGLNIVCGFDIDPEKMASEINGKMVLPFSKMPDLARRMHIDIGVITCPATAAQNVAEIMIDNGMRAIWNFTQTHLQVPEGIVVENVDLASSIAVLLTRLAKLKQNDDS
jgi:redox-sensing transcriptional repressor